MKIKQFYELLHHDSLSEIVKIITSCLGHPRKYMDISLRGHHKHIPSTPISITDILSYKEIAVFSPAITGNFMLVGGFTCTRSLTRISLRVEVIATVGLSPTPSLPTVYANYSKPPGVTAKLN